MALTLILQMIAVALLLSFIYIIIGIIPGTDETSVLVPMTLILVALKLDPLVIMAGFFASFITVNIADSIPTAITSIPGGVMSTPLVGHSQTLKRKGLTTYGLRWMLFGSLIGILVSIPISLGVWGLFKVISMQSGLNINNFIQQYTGYIFLFGAVFMSLTGKKKIVALVSIIPFGLLTALLRNPSALTVINPHVLDSLFGQLLFRSNLSMTPFFLSITTGPLLFGLFSLLVPSVFKTQKVENKIEILLAKDNKKYAHDTKKIVRKTAITGALGSLLFFLSPVGVTVMLGEFSVRNIKDETEKAIVGSTVVDALSSATYLAGILISLFVFAFPISPAALGPGKVIFEAGGHFILDNHAGLAISESKLLVPIFIGIVIGAALSITIGLLFGRKMTKFVFKYISQETVLIFLFSVIAMLSFAEAGFSGVLIIVAVGLISGFLNKKGVGYGVQFMSLYAGNLFLTILLSLM